MRNNGMRWMLFIALFIVAFGVLLKNKYQDFPFWALVVMDIIAVIIVIIYFINKTRYKTRVATARMIQNYKNSGKKPQSNAHSGQGNRAERRSATMNKKYSSDYSKKKKKK